MAACEPHAVSRLRWRCRRGLLELDLILERFLPRYESLDPAQREAWVRLLELADFELLDLLAGRRAARDEHTASLIEMMQTPFPEP